MTSLLRKAVFVTCAGLLLATSPSSADESARHRAKHRHHRSAPVADPVDRYQWYVGEYAYPSVTVYEETYSRCRMGWWQSSHFGHPRPQWATFCQR